jgi:hypothetical protein
VGNNRYEGITWGRKRARPIKIPANVDKKDMKKRPKTLWAKNMITRSSAILLTPAIEVQYTINFVALFARKRLFNKGIMVRITENRIKRKEKMGELNKGMKDCPQIGSPIIKSIARRLANRPLRVKHVLIKSFCLSPILGMNRISPIPKPSSPTSAKIPRTERSAVVRPTSVVSNNLAAIIQKRKVRPAWIPDPSIR